MLPSEREYAQLKPTRKQKVYDLAKQAGVRVGAWEVSTKDERALDPYTNSYQNSRWTFGGGDDPLVACIWWRNMSPQDIGVVHQGSPGEHMTQMANLLSLRGTDPGVAAKLRIKIAKAQAFKDLMSEAFRKRKPVRVAVLDGKQAEDEAAEPSSAEFRELDAVEWFVHSFEPSSGNYTMVRGVPMPEAPPPDPFRGAEDPAEDPSFLAAIGSGTLSDTERKALIKARVGQGYFRQALIERWNGCAFTGYKDPTLLIASHIRPWSTCTTRHERLSPDNGLLLTPNLDLLFDKGIITFDENNHYEVVFSKAFNITAQSMLHVQRGMRLRGQASEGMKPFMQYHRKHVFVG